jgi:orotidine-5'-phosphate decarboxylase
MTREQLIKQIRLKGSFLCVGLDPVMEKIPKALIDNVDKHARKTSDDDQLTAIRLLTFNRAIIDATAPYCVAYKPNLAFYEAYGVGGIVAFTLTVRYLKEFYPNHFIIADAKRGDIGNTSKMYAQSFFEGNNQVDALTIAPYMGEDSVKPFLEYKDKWVVLLALTSNKGSQDFQMTEDKDGQRLFEKVLTTSQQWGTEENMMFVVGATQGRMFEDVRRIVPNHFLLVPGVGAQGGSLEEVCRYGMNSDCGLLVNSSRGIIYASSGEDFMEKAAEKAKELQLQMTEVLDK